MPKNLAWRKVGRTRRTRPTPVLAITRVQPIKGEKDTKGFFRAFVGMTHKCEMLVGFPFHDIYILYISNVVHSEVVGRHRSRPSTRASIFCSGFPGCLNASYECSLSQGHCPQALSHKHYCCMYLFCAVMYFVPRLHTVQHPERRVWLD